MGSRDAPAGRARRADALIGAGLAVAAFALYLATLLPGLGSGDTAEFQRVLPTLGVAHPTGYPLYTILGWLWSQLPLGGAPAWRVSLLSAFAAALAVGAVYLVARALGQARVVAAAAALALAASRTFWSQATIAEVYALAALLQALLLLALLRWRGGRWPLWVAGLEAPVPALDALAAGLWAAAWLVHLATLRQIAPDESAWPHAPSTSEEQRLTRAFQFCYAGCYRLLRAVYGARRTGALDDRMDVLAATANWDVTLDRDHARIAPAVLALPLDRQGARYAEVLRYTVATIEQIAGAAFARRAIQSAYDALPWPERETASRYCFPDTPWARELSDAFGGIREMRLRLLRQVDQFLGCDDDELAALAHVMVEQDAVSGAELWRAGLPAPGVWVVEAGEVVVTRGGQVVAELHRGDSFGAAELAAGSPAGATYRAAIASSLLFIPAELFSATARAAGPAAGPGADAGATLRLLERIPLFADLPRNTLRGLAHIAQQKRLPARAVIVRQGVPSGVFYIIREGRAAVLARAEPKPDQPATVRPIAQLGPEEFFGELELLRGAPPVASVVALTPLVVLALPHAALQAFILGDGRVAEELEQVGTGRLLALREEVGAAGPSPA